MKTKVIVNADDLGYSLKVNETIADSMRRGVVSG